ncbi:MAG: hypothetical protein ABSD67_12595 [Terracidiphilus sp.]|jgi:hypothetical protein
MELIQCPNCLLSIPEASSACIHCGSAIATSTATHSFLSTQQPPLSVEEQFVPSQFFAVSLLKLAALSVCTFGIYDLYWFYCNWKLIRARDEPDISPFWRAFFAVFYCYPCFVRIKLAGAARGIESVPPFGMLAILWILFRVAWRLPEPFLLLALLKVGFLLPVQSYVNRVNAAETPMHRPNSRFTLWNWITVVIGGSVVALAIVGAFLPPK